MSAINARSRRPAATRRYCQSTRASAGSSTGALPPCAERFGPRTEAAGLVGAIWLTMPERRKLLLDARWGEIDALRRRLNPRRDMQGLDLR